MIQNLTREQYDAVEALNASRLCLIDKSPRRFQRNDQKTSPAMAMGIIIHMAFLEPAKFKSKYVVMPEFWGLTQKGERTNSANSKDVKAQRDAWLASQAPDAIIMTQDDFDALSGILGSLTEEMNDPMSPLASFMVGDKECSIVRELRGRECKGMLDIFIPNHPKYGRTIIDVKKVGKEYGAHCDEFKREVFTRDYDAKAAWYLELAKADSFFWVVVEEKFPHAVAIYNAAEYLPIGVKKVDRWFEKLSQCESTGVYPWYQRGAADLYPSDWARREEESI